MERAEGGGEKKFHLEHRIEFYAALQFYTLKYSILLVHMWLAPSQWESPFVAPKLPRKFSLHCKIRFSFSITKAVKNKWARFWRKNLNEIWKLKVEFYVKIDNARYAWHFFEVFEIIEHAIFTVTLIAIAAAFPTMEISNSPIDSREYIGEWRADMRVY